MEKRRTSGMGYGLMLVAGLFLWNPVVGMTDVLPDIIGYLFLLAGLSRIADLGDRLDGARERFRNVVWIALGELVAQMLVNIFIRNAPVVDDPHGQNLPAWTLLFSFVVFAVECYFLIPAYRELFRGLGDLAERKSAVHLKNDRRDRTQYDRMATFAVLFVAGKNLLSLLPELSSVSSYEYELGNPLFRFDWYEYVDLMRLILLIPALVLTAFWLVRWICLFSSAQKDLNFQSAIRNDYETNVASDYGLLLGRRVRLSFLLFRFGAAFLASFILLHDREALIPSVWQGIELLPDWAMICFFAVGVWFIRDLDPVRRYEVGFGTAAFVAGVVGWVFCTIYYKNHTAADARYFAEAYDRMMVLRVTGIVSSLFAGVCLCLIVARASRLIRAHLRVEYDNDPARSEVATLRVRAEYHARMIGAYLLIAFGTAGRIADLILRPWFAWVWWFSVLFTIALVLVLTSLFTDLAEGLAVRYPARQEGELRR